MDIQEAQRVGTWLVQQGYVDEATVREALEEFRERPVPQFTHLLLRRGAISPQVHGRVLAKIYNASYIDLPRRKPSREAFSRVPAEVAWRYLAMPVEMDGMGLTVAFADPRDREGKAAVSAAAGQPVQAVVSDLGDIEAALRAAYGQRPVAAEQGTGPAVRSGTPEEPDRGVFEFAEEELRAMQTDGVTVEQIAQIVDQGPTVLLVNLMLMKAIASKASDIHIEPYETTTMIRFRVDGSLYDWRNVDSRAHQHIVARIKVLSGMDTTERFVPQDGRFNAKGLVNRDIDLRVSSMPSYFGEKIVMRLLDKAGARRSLTELGMTAEDLSTFERMIRRPWGMCILTGPTGSGKTTTLYAALDRIKTITRNIMTIEDPVEYMLDRIVQVQINERQGRTFSNVLRSALRQDPDIIMVGEMRDEETAELGIRAALTGHLVLTTLHTNDAAGAIPRLVDMKVPDYLVASSVHGVVAQRLVRCVCKHCAAPYTPDHELLVWARLSEEDIADWKLLKGRGCERCNMTGFASRVGIFEIMPVSDAIRDLTLANAGGTAIRKQAVQEGMRLLRDSATEKVAAGITCLEEMVAATAL